MLNKIYEMLDRFDFPEMLDNEIELGNITIYIDSKGRLVLHQATSNSIKQIFIEIEDMNDMAIGALIYSSLVRNFDWEM